MRSQYSSKYHRPDEDFDVRKHIIVVVQCTFKNNFLFTCFRCFIMFIIVAAFFQIGA